MRTVLIAGVLLAALATAQAEIIKFDLSPPGKDNAVGMSQTNEPVVVAPSTGSGNEVFGGITYDTVSSNLTVSLAYGSFFGFSDLLSPATAAHIHVAPTNTGGPVVYSLAPLHLIVGNSGIIAGTVLYTSDADVADLLIGRHYINVHTTNNPGGEIRAQLIPLLNQPPTISCPAPVTVECASKDGTPVTLSVEVADADGDALKLTWKIGSDEVTQDVPASTTPTTMSLTRSFGDGVTGVEVSVADADGETASCSTTVTVVDTTPPVIRKITATPNILWPPNHKLAPIRLRVDAQDACSEVLSKIIGVRSNEPDNGLGDGDTAPDWEIVGDLGLNLRAERSGRGNGRIYTIMIEAKDQAGNASVKAVTVTVPKSQGKGSLDKESNL